LLTVPEVLFGPGSLRACGSLSKKIDYIRQKKEAFMAIKIEKPTKIQSAGNKVKIIEYPGIGCPGWRGGDCGSR
jgi:hypothetical protein